MWRDRWRFKAHSSVRAILGVLGFELCVYLGTQHVMFMDFQQGLGIGNREYWRKRWEGAVGIGGESIAGCNYHHSFETGSIRWVKA